MTLFLGLLVPSFAVMISFLDRIIECFLPNGLLSKISEDMDEIIVTIEDQDDHHDA